MSDLVETSRSNGPKKRFPVPFVVAIAIIGFIVAGLGLQLAQVPSPSVHKRASGETYRLPKEPHTEVKRKPTSTKSARAKSQPAAKPKAIPKRKSRAEIAREHWNRVMPVLKRADKQRNAALSKNVGEFRTLTTSLITDQGLEAFMDEALSLSSKALRLKDESEHRAWLKSKFKEHVLPIASLRQILTNQTQVLEAELGQIDNSALVAIKADVGLDPRKLRVAPTDTDRLNAYLDDVIDDIYDTVDQSMGASISSFFFGAAGFEAGRQLSRGAMEDENGDVSLLGEIISFGIGFVAEEATRAIADEVLDVRGAIETDLRAASRQLIANCTSDGVIHRERIAAPGRHQAAVFKAVTASLGIDANWALQNYR